MSQETACIYAKDVKEGMVLIDSGLWFGKGLPPGHEVSFVKSIGNKVHISFMHGGDSEADPLFKFERILDEYEWKQTHRWKP